MAADDIQTCRISRLALLPLFLMFGFGSLTVFNGIQHFGLLPQISLGSVPEEGTKSDGLYGGGDAKAHEIIQGLGGRRLLALPTKLLFHRFPPMPGHGSSVTGSVTTQTHDTPTLHNTRNAEPGDRNALHNVDPYFAYEFQKRGRRLVSNTPNLRDKFAGKYTQRHISDLIIQGPPNPAASGHMEVDYADPDVHPPGNQDPPIPAGSGHMEADYADPEIHPPGNQDPPIPALSGHMEVDYADPEVHPPGNQDPPIPSGSG